LFILDISTNFFSIFQIYHSSDGKIVEFSPNDVVIWELHDAKIVVAYAQVYHNSHLYRFASFEPSSGKSFISHVDSLSRLWHERFGHLNYRYLQQMNSQKLFLGHLKVSCSDEVCPGCFLGKHHQDPFLKGKASRATIPLELVHSDIMIFLNHSFSGAKYALTFIDDFSCQSWVYFLKYKSEFLATFKTFKALIEKKSSLSINNLCIDNVWYVLYLFAWKGVVA